VDLELARAELKRLRQERDLLKAKVQRALGQQIDRMGNIELERRIRELGDELDKRDAALAKGAGRAGGTAAEVERGRRHRGRAQAILEANDA
jgi:hypothetical protein